MISLEQIRTLENRVHGAVERIKSLTAENDALSEKLSDYERRIDELQAMVSEFKTGQEEIERGIMSALSQLDGLEDQVSAEAGSDAHVSTAPAPENDNPGSDNTNEENTDQENASQPDSGQEPAEGMHVSIEGESDSDPDSEPRTTVDLIESDEEEPELDIF